jgi:transcription antitermination factor NusG
MPILHEEPNLYPESLLDPEGIAENGASPERRWCICLAKPRQEKGVARLLRARKIPFFLPMLRRQAVYQRHRVTVSTPLFGGYLFLFASEEEQVTATSITRAAQVFPAEDPKQLLADLRQIQRLLATDTPLAVQEHLLPGQPVRVKQGPLSGLEGIVQVLPDGKRLSVPVRLLQQTVLLDIDDSLLEPVQ